MKTDWLKEVENVSVLHHFVQISLQLNLAGRHSVSVLCKPNHPLCKHINHITPIMYSKISYKLHKQIV